MPTKIQKTSSRNLAKIEIKIGISKLITPIHLNTVNPYKKSKTGLNKPYQSSITFGQRPEFGLLSYTYRDPLASVFFRRGTSYACQSNKFADVVKTLKELYKLQPAPKILVVGVGKAQEPLSYLAVIKDLNKTKPVESAVDLHCVDLQDKITDGNLEKYAFMQEYESPRFAEESFENISKNPKKNLFRIKPELLNYLKKIFNNPEKTKWETKIQDFAIACKSKVYDMVSINNVLLYIRNKKERIQLIQDLTRIIKENGFLVTDPDEEIYMKKILNMENFKRINDGIWQKGT